LEVSAELATAFEPGDSLFAVESTGEILHVPRAAREIATGAVDRAVAAFAQMGSVTDAQISRFFEQFASRLEDDALWKKIVDVNRSDVEDAQRRGRSTTRLIASDSLRKNVVDGLLGWVSQVSRRGQVIERVQHEGWHADLIGAELGVVGFVFEGRPNVVADATGVLRGGNTVVFRIGRDALGTAKAILEQALVPALEVAGLPRDAVGLVDSPTHAAGWALFSDPRLSLAVARGSGPAVATLGSLAQRAGVPVSLHGTGGAWITAGASAEVDDLEQVVFDSLDRKVCNTLNTCCIPESAAAALVPAFLRGMQRAGERLGQDFKLHVARGSERHVPPALFANHVKIRRAEGGVEEPQAELIDESALGVEWEWEASPEVSLVVTRNTDHAINLFNRLSPQFVATLVSSDAEEHEHFFRKCNAPFVGDGFTRWVDGQFALKRPELGLSNWQNGRLFGRGGVLSGDGVYTVRTRVSREK
jgi:glutamate-5-semialdehyde dehydrogenase